ncbi:zonadhesin-like [Arctopsyche grandis]|uniref:zonadhesin-like n=1 Tax=Arctopsyche grandis TaxID=121162 RepID=UPI00406D7C14
MVPHFIRVIKSNGRNGDFNRSNDLQDHSIYLILVINITAGPIVNTCPGANQVFAPCGNDGCQRSCTRLDVTNCNPVCFTPGCICATGFVRDAGGACIQLASCPTTACTGPNEIFSVCGNNGCQRSCLRLDVINCIPVCGAPGCICDVGFVRNSAGFCVIPSTCTGNPTCNGANEVFSACGNDGCQATCTTPTPVPCVSNCVAGGGCICQAGFVRNAVRECVAPSTCPATPTCPGANQVFTACGNDGCQATCLRPTPPDCVGTCTTGGGCVCRPGFVKNSAGNCITQGSCPVVTTCTAPNQVFSACGDDGCQATCTTPTPVACMSNCVAGGGCICATGFVRNSLGACVAPASCPTTCPANQVFSACGNDNCQASCTRPNPSPCTGTCVAGGGCICQAGFVQDGAGNCINPATCPVTCTAANEIFSACGNNACQSTCTTAAPVGCTGPCISGCICQTGFFRNAAGVCVAAASCPPLTCTGPNEMFSTCGQDGCQATCTTLTVPAGCVSMCTQPSCICVAGFVRNSAGTCVRPINCPPLTCTRNNEIFSFCGEDGCQRTCSKLNIGTCTPTCTTAGCICADGFVRNAAGACVLPSTCPPVCTGSNEVFSMCGNDGCQRDCTRLDITGCIAICSNPGCICDTGFVRNSAGACVLPSTCPTMCTNPNEVFTSCDNTNCQATCTQAAIIPCPSPCTSGCICATGFLRNPAGVCVLQANCMDCGVGESFRTCGPNECDGTCAMPDLGTSTSCTSAGLCTMRCFCRPGFVRSTTGICVNRAACP